MQLLLTIFCYIVYFVLLRWIDFIIQSNQNLMFCKNNQKLYYIRLLLPIIFVSIPNPVYYLSLCIISYITLEAVSNIIGVIIIYYVFTVYFILYLYIFNFCPLSV